MFDNLQDSECVSYILCLVKKNENTLKKAVRLVILKIGRLDYKISCHCPLSVPPENI